jgi:hypothetical protein
MKAILIVDHGSRLREANDMLVCMANLIQTMAGPDIIVPSRRLPPGSRAALRQAQTMSPFSRTCCHPESIPPATSREWSRKSPQRIPAFGSSSRLHSAFTKNSASSYCIAQEFPCHRRGMMPMLKGAGILHAHARFAVKHAAQDKQISQASFACHWATVPEQST